MNTCSDRHPVRSGIPCIKHNCVQCCIETRMPLSPLDIKRIMKLGYGLNDFTIPLDGGWRLKNVSGRCVFLAEGGCTIYPYRPKGCQLYPLIYDEGLRQAVIDHLCPYGCEFKVRKGDIKKLNTLLERLEKEAKIPHLKLRLEDLCRDDKPENEIGKVRNRSPDAHKYA